VMPFGATRRRLFAFARTTEVKEAKTTRWVQWTEPGRILCRSEVLGSHFGRQMTPQDDNRLADDDDGDAGADDPSALSFYATVVDDGTSVKEASRILRQQEQRGGGKNGSDHVLVYQGHYANALQLLSALKRRARKRPLQRAAADVSRMSVTEQWKLHRQRAKEEAQELNRLLLEVRPDHTPTTAKTPDSVPSILRQFVGPRTDPYLVPLREILARIGSHQWRTKGVPVPQLDHHRLHPHYGVYPPTRQDYLDLLPQAHPCLSNKKNDTKEGAVVMDVGTGTGILAAILLHRHPNVTAIGTDINPLAIACAQENLTRLGFGDRMALYQTDLFADRDADVLVCNPPWIPGTAESWLEHAVYDGGGMLYGFLRDAASHMRGSDSEAWLILSDLAEHLQLRSREELLQRIHDGGLEIVETRAAVPQVAAGSKPTKQKTKKKEEADPLPKVADARRAETTHLYRLRKRAA